ncbi:MAG: DsrE/DsrF/DrsH-like family protein [Gammaproteobacteria bacterium]|nr:DsrE/DsrF/DrsH-like family protein [Gammaproteobacteria bacterium]
MAITEVDLKGALAGLTQSELDQWFDQSFDRKMAEREAAHTPSLAIIATKGTMDMAYPPFILASTAAALGWDVSIFFTFYGLELLKKDLDLNVTPIGNPAMPMKMPFGPQWFQGINWNMPNALINNMPGFEGMTKGLFNKTLKNKGVASISELREICAETDVKMVACQMTVDLFGYDQNEFIPEVNEWIGATSFLPVAASSDVTLFV